MALAHNPHDWQVATHRGLPVANVRFELAPGAEQGCFLKVRATKDVTAFGAELIADLGEGPGSDATARVLPGMPPRNTLPCTQAGAAKRPRAAKPQVAAAAAATGALALADSAATTAAATGALAGSAATTVADTGALADSADTTAMALAPHHPAHSPRQQGSQK